MMPCPVCGSREAEELPPPHPFRSATSGLTLLKAPLKRMQCLSCGLGRNGGQALGSKTAFYRENYGLYHHRPGTAASETERYDAMAVWMLSELGEFKPASVLDFGCGGGLLLDALRRARPTLLCAGLDPSITNTEAARARGFTVATGSVPGIEDLFEGSCDLAVASNVISHILDPRAFLAAMLSTIAPGGRLLIYGHNGDAAGADLLWTDIEYSLCREHLVSIAAKVGLEHINPQMAEPPPGQSDKYVLVFKQSDAQPAAAALSQERRDALLEERRSYFAAWQELARRLAQVNSQPPLLNFGASFWSATLAIYCPQYWGRVEACVVDDGDPGEFFDKPVMSTDSIEPGSTIVLGTNPATHQVLAKRLSRLGNVVAWDDLIKR